MFLAGSSGSHPPSPTMLAIRTPGSDVNRILTSSPGRSIAKPRMSNPQATLATVGAKTRISAFHGRTRP